MKIFLRTNIEKFMYKPEVETAKAYTIGLIKSVKKPVIKVISSETGFNVVDLSMFLDGRYQYWNNDDIFTEEIKSCDDDGSLSLDTFAIARENNKKTETRKVRASSLKRTLEGLEFLVMHYTKGNTSKIVGLKLINSRADMIIKSEELIGNYLTYHTVTSVQADNHFFHEELINFLNEKGIGLISKPRKNGKWSKKQLKERVSEIDIKSFRYYPKIQSYAKGLILEHEKYGICKVVIVKPSYRAKEEDCYYVVSTNIDNSVMEIIKGKKIRWKIEVVFRDCNQNLGLKYCQCTELKSITNHVFMVFMAYNLLSELKEKYRSTIGKIKKTIAPYISTTTNITDVLEARFT